MTGTTDDNNEADSLLARLDVNDVTEMNGVVTNGIIDDAVADPKLANGTVAKEISADETPANGKNSSREKTRTLKKGKKSRY